MSRLLIFWYSQRDYILELAGLLMSLTRSHTYLVIVGGWRTAGVFDTLQQAQERAKTCISRHVDIVEVNDETQIVHDVPHRLSGFEDENCTHLFEEVD